MPHVPNGMIDDPAFISQTILNRVSWLRRELALQVLRGVPVACIVELLELELAYWRPQTGTALEAWQA